MLFGDKKEFAIEIEFEDNKQYAYILLYLSNIYIGKKDDITYVPSFFASLENEFENIQELPIEYRKLSCIEIFKILYPANELDDYPEELYNFSIANLEDTFDPFSMLAYKIDDDQIMFCSELDIRYYNPKNYPLGIHNKQLNYTYVKNTIKKAVEYVSNVLDN